MAAASQAPGRSLGTGRYRLEAMSSHVPPSSTAPLEARRFLERLQAELSTGVTRLLAAIPGRPVRELMRTPLRRPVLEAVFWALPQALNGTRAHEVTRAVRCHVTGRPDGGFDTYMLEFADQRWSARVRTVSSRP